ncbi:MAG: AAA family ATPase [Corynebacterium sp.]|nr:AAA family ATPase [Corynebacterium sp.]
MAIHFTRQAQQALSILSQGHNLLLTGAPGSGKTTLLAGISAHYQQRNVLQLAPTAAPGTLNVPTIFPAAELSTAAQALVRHTDILVLDDAHLLSQAQLERMSAACSRLRENPAPFGGIQVIVAADLYAAQAPYFFDATCLREFPEVSLHQHWHTTDARLARFTQQLRTGTAGREVLEELNEYLTTENRGVLVSPTAAEQNTAATDALPAPHFKAATRVAGQADLDAFAGVAELRYAAGSRVRFIADDPQGHYAKGQFGTISFADPSHIEVQLDEGGKIVAVYPYTWYTQAPAVSNNQLVVEATGSLQQFPVVPAWALDPGALDDALPQATIDTKHSYAPGAFAHLLAYVPQRDLLNFNGPLLARHVRSDTTLVRRISQRHAQAGSYDRVAFIATEQLSTGEIYRIQVLVIAEGQAVAEFGSWINPEADISELELPAGGLGLAPRLADFWPLLRRQVAGALVFGDSLAAIEADAEFKMHLGAGFDAAEIGVELIGDPVERARQLASVVLQSPLPNGVVADNAVEAEGALFVPQWALGAHAAPMFVDMQRATDADVAWLAFNGAPVRPQRLESLEALVETVAATAATRGLWDTHAQQEVQQRAQFVAQAPVAVPNFGQRPAAADLLLPGTAVALSGTRHIGGYGGDDTAVARMLNDRGLYYTTTVSPDKCGVVVAADPAASSEKIQAAQASSIPVLPLAEFEQWYVYGPFHSQASQTHKTASDPTLYDPAAALPPGTRVAFHGPVEIHGQQLRSARDFHVVCADLGLEYRPAVTKSGCEVLVTTDPGGSDIANTLAARYHKRLVQTSSFVAWAESQLGSGYTVALERIATGEPTKTPEPVADELHDATPGAPSGSAVPGAPASPAPEAQYSAAAPPYADTSYQQATDYDVVSQALVPTTTWEQPHQEALPEPASKATIAKSGAYFFGFASLTCFILSAVAHFLSEELTKTMLVYGGISLGLAVPFALAWLLLRRRA